MRLSDLRKPIDISVTERSHHETLHAPKLVWMVIEYNRIGREKRGVASGSTQIRALYILLERPEFQLEDFLVLLKLSLQPYTRCIVYLVPVQNDFS